MVNGRLMYLRPGNLFKDFIIEHSKSDLKSGRPSVSYEGDGTDFLRGCLASANEVDKAHGTADHIITHVIVQRGKDDVTDAIMDEAERLAESEESSPFALR